VAKGLGIRIVAVSPHSDDAVLSIGAALHRWARRGVRIELLTVFALDPASRAATRGWDLRGGFATERDAALARRDEDRRACAVLGVTPDWLPFGSVDYERHGDEAEVRDAVLERAEGAAVLLLPGSPLSHPDHEWLVRAVAGRTSPARLGLYAEQPYTRRSGSAPVLPGWLAAELGARSFEGVEAGLRDRLAKWRAIRRYGSQLPLLAMKGSVRRGPLALSLHPERVAWVGDRVPV
jgi:LmbE family N-acetylglucosaminyl deacetylase